jgi:hypothetical protein
MHLARIAIESSDGADARIVAAADKTPDRWMDVRAAERLRLLRAGASESGARRLAAALVPGSLSEAVGGGEAFIEAAHAAAGSDDEAARAGDAPRFLAPIDPVAYRDFMAFEQHFVTATRKLRGGAPAPVLYELPVSYFGNAHAILGPEDVIPWPHYSDHTDYELELGIVRMDARAEDAVGVRPPPQSRPQTAATTNVSSTSAARRRRAPAAART